LEVKEVRDSSFKQVRRSAAQGKNDILDALLIARVALREAHLPPPPQARLTHGLKTLVDHPERCCGRPFAAAIGPTPC
jgi:hypothetical protein